MGVSASNTCFSKKEEGPRPLLQLHQLRSLDIVLMATKRRIGDVEIPADAARRMYHQNKQAYTPSHIEIPKFDAVGLISITPKAMKEGITHDTVHVILATPFGIRSLPLSEVLGQCSDIAIRQVFLPGEQPRREDEVVPHPMPTMEDALKEARAARNNRNFFRANDPIYGIPYPPPSQNTTSTKPTGAAAGAGAGGPGMSSFAFAAAPKATSTNTGMGMSMGVGGKSKDNALELPSRSPESVLFSNTYSLPEPNVPLCPYNNAIHNAGAASKRRHMHMRVLYACLGAFDKLYMEEEVAGVFVNAMRYIRRRLRLNLPDATEIDGIVTVVEEYCAKRAPLREEARAKAKELVLRRIQAAEKDVKATVKRIERELNDSDEDGDGGVLAGKTKALYRDSTLMTEEEKLAELEKRNAARSAQHEANELEEQKITEEGPLYLPSQLSYGDLAALMGLLCTHGHAVMMSKAEVTSLIRFFLDPRRPHPHITTREYLVTHLRAILRNAAITRQYQYFLSGAIVSQLLQMCGILPEDAEHFYEPAQYLQGNNDVVSHVHALISREHTIPMPEEPVYFDEKVLYRRERRRFLRGMVAHAILRHGAKREAALRAARAQEEEAKVKRAKEREERKKKMEDEVAKRLKKAEEEMRLAEEAELKREREIREAKEREDMERRKKEKEEMKKKQKRAYGGDEDEDEDDEDSEEEKKDDGDEEDEAEEDEAANAERVALVDAAGDDRAVLVTFSVSNLPAHLVNSAGTSSSLSSFATTCAVWDAEAVDDQGQQCPTLVAYTPSVRGDLNPDYQTACMLSYARGHKNHFEVLICQCDDPQTLASAPVLCRTTIDLTHILASFARTQQHLVYPLTDPQTGAESGALEVLVFSEAMTELVLYLGSDVAVFKEDHGSVLCTYEGLQALLRASGEDLLVCQRALKEIHDAGGKYSSMCELAAAVATHRARQGCGDAVYSDAVRQSIYEAVRVCGMVDVSYVSAAMVEPLIRAYSHVGSAVLAIWRMRGVGISNWTAFLTLALQNRDRGGFSEGVDAHSADSGGSDGGAWTQDVAAEVRALLSKIVVAGVEAGEMTSVCTLLANRVGGTTPLVWILRALARAKYTYQTLESLSGALQLYI